MTETTATAEAVATEDDIEAWLQEATPDEARVPVCMNRALLAEFDQLITELEVRRPAKTFNIALMDEEQQEDDVEFNAMAHRLIELRNLIEEDERKHTFHFQRGDYEEWRKIVEKYPPTPAQLEKYRGFLDHDEEAAAPAMIAFSCIRPKMTEEQAVKLRSKVPENIYQKLYGAALRVNRTGGEIPKSVLRTVDQLVTELRSTSPAATASPSPASAVGLLDQENQSGTSTT